MVENRFNGCVYCQTAKYIFEVTLTEKKYFEESKRTISDIHPRLFHLSSGVEREDKLGHKVLDAGLRADQLLKKCVFAIF